MEYRRASTRQIAYLQALYAELGLFDDTPYIKYTVARAAKRIKSLKRKVDKQRSIDSQSSLF